MIAPPSKATYRNSNRPREVWVGERLETLKRLYGEGRRTAEIALALGCSTSVVLAKVREFGFRPVSAELPERIDDTAHVERCLAAGGFVTPRKLADGRLVLVKPARAA